MDNLKTVSNDTKYSSSAVDTLTVLFSIKKFWEDLQWPDKSDSEKIIINISGDICRFSAIYFDNIVDRVEKLETMKHFGIFQVPLEVCIAACNIEFVSQGIQKLLTPKNGEAPENEQSKNCIENTLKHGRSRAKKLIKRSIKKMVPSMRKLFIEGADVVKTNGEVGDRVILYIDDAIVTFSKDLEEIDFLKAKQYLWQSVLDVFCELIGKSLELKREPIFYSNLKIIFQELQEIFTISIESESERIQKIEFLLNRHCLNTSKLIHQYFKDRYQMQQEISKTPFHLFGVLSIHCFFFHNVLKIEILNAKNLIPVGGNKKCDSFVKINIFPEENFANCQNYKTKVEIGTHFPLYDELFEM